MRSRWISSHIALLSGLLLAPAGLTGCIGGDSHYPHTSDALALQRVVLYRNGVGYFERGGKFEGDVLTHRLPAHGELEGKLRHGLRSTFVEYAEDGGTDPGQPRGVVQHRAEDVVRSHVGAGGFVEVHVWVHGSRIH